MKNEMNEFYFGIFGILCLCACEDVLIWELDLIRVLFVYEDVIEKFG